jgi:4-hydroxy-2-oxoheptanedioate aldolase
MNLLAEAASALRGAWEAGSPTYGAWCSIPSSFSAEILGHVGFDWACVDLQHGLTSGDALLPMMQALAVTRTPTLVRVPGNEPAAITRALDLGAVGVIIPMVNDAASAREAVSACRYAPEGTRSYGPTRAALVGGDAPVDVVNRLVICAVMIETEAALADLDGILSTVGVDAAFIGPADLRVSLGIAEVADPAFVRLLADIAARCRERGVVPGIFCPATDLVPAWRDMGFQMLAVESDVRFLRGAASAALARVRSGDEGCVASPVEDSGYV